MDLKTKSLDRLKAEPPPELANFDKQLWLKFLPPGRAILGGPFSTGLWAEELGLSPEDVQRAIDCLAAYKEFFCVREKVWRLNKQRPAGAGRLLPREALPWMPAVQDGPVAVGVVVWVVAVADRSDSVRFSALASAAQLAIRERRDREIQVWQRAFVPGWQILAAQLPPPKL